MKPVDNMSYNYVALGLQKHKIPIALKISYDAKLIQDEYKALKHFAGLGAIKVLDAHLDYHALLLKQAVPGHLLKEQHPQKLEDTIHIYSQVVKALAARSLPKSNNYPHVSEWCTAIDKIQDPRIEKRLVVKAKQLRSKLLHSVEHEYLCHGDLHLENIIQHGANWLAIDPKGIMGEVAFEAAAFDLISPAEIQDTATLSAKIIDRVGKLSIALEISFDRLLAWVFLRIIISVQWFIEDNGDPSEMLILAKYVYSLVYSART